MVSHNFCWLDKCFSTYDKSETIIIPVPFETTSTYGTGSIKGPHAIIEASGNMELYDEQCAINPCEKGIHTVDTLNLSAKGTEKVLADIEKIVKKAITSGKFPVVLGGEHTVSLGAIRALKGSFTVLSIDAHADMRTEYNNSKYNHACVMRRAFDICGHVVLAGVRSMCEEEKNFIDNNNIPVFYAKDIADKGEWIKAIIDSLKDNVYISLDVDALDPSFMPATGTPEPGGLSYSDVVSLLSEIAKSKNILGFDIVELAPIKHLHFAEYTAAKIVYKLLAFREFHRNKNNPRLNQP